MLAGGRERAKGVGVRLLVSVVLLLLLVPGWTGVDRLPLISRDVRVHAAGWSPEGGWPRRIGALEPVGALSLSASDPAFGGFSALALHDGRATLLSDGGNVVSLAIVGNRIDTLRARFLPTGPGTGWAKESRDTESLAHDPASGRWWIGYERDNSIWRYDPGFDRGEARRRMPMRKEWKRNGGAESLVRLHDHRFLVIAEGRVDGPARPALLFDGDPALAATRVSVLSYRAPASFSPSDAAELPNGDLLTLNRRFRYPFRFFCEVAVVPRAQIRPGGAMRARVIARLTPALLGENCEGVAITRERGQTMVWIVTDNDLAWYRPTILAKFRLMQGG